MIFAFFSIAVRARSLASVTTVLICSAAAKPASAALRFWVVMVFTPVLMVLTVGLAILAAGLTIFATLAAGLAGSALVLALGLVLALRATTGFFAGLAALAAVAALGAAATGASGFGSAAFTGSAVAV